MRKLSNCSIIIFLLIFILISSTLAQAPDTLWTKIISDGSSQIAYTVYSTTDGGFVLGGYTSSGYSDFYMVKTDGLGEVVWAKSYGEDDRYEAGNWMAETSDGGYILAGSRAQDPPYSSSSDIYLVKTDGNGNEEWTSIIGDADISETPNCIVQTSDGGYIMCGHYWVSSQTVYDVWLLKTNSIGIEEWTQFINFEDGMAEYALGIQQTEDGGYVVTGKTQAFSGDYSDNAYILKTNMIGEMEWLKTYGNSWPWYETATNIVQTSDGGFIICGNQDNDGIDKNWFVVKADGEGNEIWSDNSIGGGYHDGAFFSCETSDGGYAVAGNYHEGVWNPFVTKYNIDGDTLWTKMWSTGDDNSQYLFCIRRLEDGGFITVGSTTLTGGGHGIYLTRLSPETVSIVEAEDITLKNAIELQDNYPNPFSSSTVIPYMVNTDGYVSISIYNVYGQKIEELENTFQYTGSYEIEFKSEGLQSGIYYCVLSAGNQILSRKVICQKEK